MKYSFFMAVAALMALAACSNDNDILEPQQPATDGLLRTPVTITANYGEGGDNAGTTRVAYTESGANITATWQISDQIEVVVDGQVSTLTLTNGAGTSSATFVGTISHTKALTSTTPLVCYVKDASNPSAVTVNSDGSYIYTSGTFLGQDGTLDGAARCNLFYGMTPYGDGTNITCDFSINTSMMKFTIDASGLTEGEATLSYNSGDVMLASATFTIASDGKNTVYMTIPANHYTGAQTLHYVSASNSIDATATLSDTQATFIPGQTYRKSFMLLHSATGAITVNDGVTLFGTGGTGTYLTIADDATVNLIGVNINTSAAYAAITCAGDATINLRGTNTVKSSLDNYPGIFIPSLCLLSIGGSGSLTATGGEKAAGIGSGYNSSCGKITINGGTVTATGGDGAGIGSGMFGSCDNITINGGTVTATGGYGAGIGSGFSGSCDDITIKGGTVIATSINKASGIGCGFSGFCDIITIDDGTVTATGGMYSAGIGCSSIAPTDNSNVTYCGDIFINGGTITANGGEYGAGIGSGPNSPCADITIDGGTVTATGGDAAAGIGSGSNGSCDDITINNTVTQVKATKGSDAAMSIGAGSAGTCTRVTIGGSVYWNGSDFLLNGETYLSSSPLIYPSS